MPADMIREVIPLGIVGLAIIAVVLLALNPGSKTNLWLVVGAMTVIVALTVFDRLTSKQRLQEDTGKPPAVPASVAASASMFWVDTGTNADWGGRDVAYTSGYLPKYKVKETALCDDHHDGAIATCWQNRSDGFPKNVPTDVEGAIAQWCTYKDSTIKISTPPDGGAPRGRVYICARSIPRT